MYKIGDIIEVEVSGIENYGIFAKAEDDYTGLIHISEIDNNYKKDINQYFKVGDDIYANVIGEDDAIKHLKLYIKNIKFEIVFENKPLIKENIKGFLPLHNKLDEWIKDTLNDMNEK